MKTAGRAVLQFLGIGVVALIVAFAANAIRADGSLQVTKNYFDTGASRLPVRAHDETPSSTSEPMDSTAVGSESVGSEPIEAREKGVGARAPDSSMASRGVVSEPADSDPVDADAPEVEHLDHPYQDITFEEVAELVDDPLTQAGLNVFIDARNEQRFAEGRIPGAMLCNPYRVTRYLDREVDGLPMIDHILNAEKVIVYCGGGRCEDSIFMARELLELDVPFDAIYIYAGGWSDWVARGGRVEKGR